MENAFAMRLNVKKTKAVWLGQWSKNRSTPLQLTWTRDPVKILGIHFCYDEKQNNYYNFANKIQKLQTNLDPWKSRNLTLFGKVLTIRSLQLSHHNLSIQFQISVYRSILEMISGRSSSASFGRTKRTKLKEYVYIKITQREEFVCVTLISR